MCGIVGWFSSRGEARRDLVRAMSAAVAHRGPDDVGEYFDDVGGCGLGFRRLAIRDLSSASHQPMVDRARGNVLAFNGEIDNFAEIRRDLEARGYRFCTTGDTEVLLLSYAEWGERCFERLAGMFAVAVWEETRRRLVLARDALGIKPLYFAPTGAGIAFASEAKALRHLPEFQRRLRERSLVEFLEFGYVFEPERSMFEGVERLEPGTVLVAEDGRIRRRFRHWVPPQPVPEPDRSGSEDPVDRLHRVLGTVVREHLVADVPVGVLLSGGLDSSVVAAYAARDQALTTVTMAFTDSRIDEREPARAVARHLGSRHLEIEISPREIREEVAAAAWVFDDLFADWGTLSTRLIYRKFRDLGFRVALTGEGADELFAGYPIFDEGRRARGVAGEARLYRRYASRRWGALLGEFRAELAKVAPDGDHELFESIRRFEVLRQLPANYVMKVDKACMSVSLEARTPYLDRRVADVALAADRSWLHRGGENKWMLREAARRHRLLPGGLAGRVKFGASIAASWIEEDSDFRSFARDVVLDPGGWTASLGLRGPMERYFAGKRGYPTPHPLAHLQPLAWRLLLLNLWAPSALAVPAPAATLAPRPAGSCEVAGSFVRDLVSVVIPVHNRPTLLTDAVASALDQSHRPIEILIVDDGSTDETGAVAEVLARRSPGIVRHLRRGNGGPGLARECGRREARGEFVQYLDSDDLLLPEKLAAQVAALRAAPGAVAAYCATKEVDSDGSVRSSPHRPSDVAIDRMFPAFLAERWWNTVSPLYRTEASERAGPWSDARLEEDWEYDARIAALDRPVAFVPRVLAVHRDAGGPRLSRSLGVDSSKRVDQVRRLRTLFTAAKAAGVSWRTPEARTFARSAFHLARQCAASGLEDEASSALLIARAASRLAGRGTGDLRLFETIAAVVGWRAAGSAALVLERARAAS